MAAHSWGVLAGVGSVLVLALGWHLNACVTDKRDTVRKLRQVYLSHKAADEKFDQDLITFYRNTKSFLTYLDQGAVQLDRIQQYQAQLDSLARIANDDCNVSKDAFYKLEASKTETARYYQFPNWDYELDTSHKCASISAIAGGVGMPDAQKLATDKKFRSEWVEKQRPAEKRSDDALLTQPRNFREYSEAMETLLQQMETRNSNLSNSCWECLVTTLGSSTKL